MKLNDESGTSILSSIIAVGIIAVVISAASTMNVNSTQVAKSLELTDAKLQLRNQLLKKVDCLQTLNPSIDSYNKGDNPPACTGISFTTLKGKDGLPVFKSAKVDRFLLQASCDPKNGIVVKAAYVGRNYASSSKTAPEFLKDPLNKFKTWDFDHEKASLFPEKLGLCRELFNINFNKSLFGKPGYKKLSNLGSYYDVLCEDGRYVHAVKNDSKKDDHLEGIYCK
ncbi:MAG: hypothetical protein R3B45_04515 [Bdellovibrionota bacterium]